MVDVEQENKKKIFLNNLGISLLLRITNNVLKCLKLYFSAIMCFLNIEFEYLFYLNQRLFSAEKQVR
jgi:hypothetical protein